MTSGITSGPTTIATRGWAMTSARRAGIGRRTWLAGLALGALGWRAARARADADDAAERIRARGRESRMDPFEEAESAHFRAVGDAPARFRKEALDLAEAFAADYFAHFRGKGFALEWPAGKLPVVVLASAKSYVAFEKGDVDEAVGGHFDLDANWLVTYDARAAAGAGVARAADAGDPRLDNTLTLVHETFHQLSYNTGLLDRRADVPLCLVEGLATYAETWRPGRRPGGTIGAVNARRRQALAQAGRGGTGWIPLKAMLADDALVDAQATAQVAYAEGWLLAHKLLKDPARLVQLRDYLKEAPPAGDAAVAKRVERAAARFGDLDRLDRDIRTPIPR